MSGSHYAPDPWRYGLEDTIYEMTPVTAVTTPPQSNGAPDLRTGPERDADAVAALTARVEYLEAVLSGFISHVAAMSDADVRAALGEAERTIPPAASARAEERFAALEDAVHRQAQMLQVLWLERERRQ